MSYKLSCVCVSNFPKAAQLQCICLQSLQLLSSTYYDIKTDSKISIIHKPICRHQKYMKNFCKIIFLFQCCNNNNNSEAYWKILHSCCLAVLVRVQLSFACNPLHVSKMTCNKCLFVRRHVASISLFCKHNTQNA